MKVFVTGASGYIGAEVAKVLKADGHTIVGLVRSQESADKLRSAGIDPLIGTLQQPELLAKAASEADAVIHTAFEHAGPGTYEDAIHLDCVVIKAMTDAMAGTNKPFVMSSGTAVMGNTGPVPVSEDFPIDPETHLRLRVKTERVTLVAAGKGVRTVVFRLPPFVWGNGGSYFIPIQLATARKLRKAYYLLPGDQMTNAAHVEDVARAYILALKHAPAGSIYNIATSNDSTIKSIAEAVGANTGVPVEGVSVEEALKQELWPAWVTTIWSFNNRPSFAKAERELHWGNFKNINMLDDISSGSYK